MTVTLSPEHAAIARHIKTESVLKQYRGQPHEGWSLAAIVSLVDYVRPFPFNVEAIGRRIDELITEEYKHADAFPYNTHYPNKIGGLATSRRPSETHNPAVDLRGIEPQDVKTNRGLATDSELYFAPSSP